MPQWQLEPAQLRVGAGLGLQCRGASLTQPIFLTGQLVEAVGIVAGRFVVDDCPPRVSFSSPLDRRRRSGREMFDQQSGSVHILNKRNATRGCWLTSDRAIKWRHSNLEKIQSRWDNMKKVAIFGLCVLSQTQAVLATDAMNAPIERIEGFARECIRYETIEAGTEIRFGVIRESETTFNVGIEWYAEGIFGDVVLFAEGCLFSKADGDQVGGLVWNGLDRAINIGTFILQEELINQYEIDRAISLLERAGYTIIND